MSDDARTDAERFNVRDEVKRMIETNDRLRAELSASRERERATAARAARLTEAGNEAIDALTRAWNEMSEARPSGLSEIVDRAAAAWREAVGGDAPTDGPPCQFCRAPLSDGHRSWCPVRAGRSAAPADAPTDRTEARLVIHDAGVTRYHADGSREALCEVPAADERDRELTFLRRHAETLQDGMERAWAAIPDNVEGEDDSLASHIVAALAAAAAPADDTAAPDGGDQ